MDYYRTTKPEIDDPELIDHKKKKISKSNQQYKEVPTGISIPKLLFILLFLTGVWVASMYIIKNKNTIEETMHSKESVKDSLALLEILGRSTDNTLNWDSSFPMQKWEGVKLNSYGRVISLDLTNSQKSKIEFDAIPPALGKLSELLSLTISGTGCSSLPYEIKNLRRLSKLTLVRNKLQTLPAEIGKLENLKILNCNSNYLQSLPSEISNLWQLSHLDFSNNRLHALPEDFGDLDNLKTLNLGCNKLESLPESIKKMKVVTHVDISYNNLKTVPEGIGELQNMTVLHLNNNELESLPKEIMKATNLTALFLHKNRILYLPKEIAQLENVTILTLEDNLLYELPNEVATLKNLRSLGISGNYFSEKKVSQLLDSSILILD